MSDSVHIDFATATEDDFEDLFALRMAAMHDSLARIGRLDAIRSRERFHSGFAPERTRHILAGGVRVGFVVVKPVYDELLLDHLYVHPDFQGRGIGAVALRAVIDEANAQRLPLRLCALRGSDSNRFYQRHGFVPVDEQEYDIYYERPVDE